MSRGALIDSAVSFLRDPSAANSPLNQRIDFLKSKGLSQQEIDQAISIASSSSSSSSSTTSAGNYGYNTTTNQAGGRYGNDLQFERDWRDWFIMSVIAGSAGYVAVNLLKVGSIPLQRTPSQRPSTVQDRTSGTG
jgi:peroxin-14